MVRNARLEEIPHAWLTGDEQFGKSPPLHDWLDELGERYILGACSPKLGPREISGLRSSDRRRRIDEEEAVP
jgi:hypothetical protein